MARTVISVKDLRKRYSLGSMFRRREIDALGGIGFEVKSDKPTIVSLIGESGSGKTTLAKLMLRIVDPSGGFMEVAGRKIIAGKKERIGDGELKSLIQPIFQNPFEAFNSLKTVDTYLRDTAVNIRKAEGKETVEAVMREALLAVGLLYEDVKGKYPNQFSGGELQRISIARAMIAKPALIVADEPVSMVDASLRMNIVNLFRRIKDEYGTSFLYITHDLATAYYISDYIVILYRGRIVEAGDARTILLEPMHPYTKLLLNSVPLVGKKWATRERMSDIESREYRLEGCKFCNRCPDRMEGCEKEPPGRRDLGDGRSIYCYKYY
jgi:oligopeptide/dipeptide ABC transporter ATP-binding protein